MQPEYTECEAFPEGTGKASVIGFTEFTTCHYNFKGVTTKGNPTFEEKEEHANYAIKCTTAGDVAHTKVTALKLNCATTPEQEIKHGIRYTNITDPETGKKAIEVHFTPHSIKSITPNTAACPTASGKEEIHENGTYTGTVDLTGFKDVNHTEPTDIFVE